MDMQNTELTVILLFSGQMFPYHGTPMVLFPLATAILV